MEDGGGAAAPFVAKTYSMVNDPATDGVITWGQESNSFVVINPYAFSRSLLPAHFKHSNFSSFVRQLNTYGFRKVDPDRWEFAHESFLRGQTHLLSRIVRRNSGGTRGKSAAAAAAEDEEEGKVVMEVVRLKREQRATEEEVQRMWRRVRDAERRPKQMMAFLVHLLGDPELLGRLMGRACEDAGREKRARLMLEGNSGSSEPVAAVDMVEHLGLGNDSPLSFEEFEEFVGDDAVGPFLGIDGADAFTPAVDPAGFCGGRPAPSYAFDYRGGEMDGGGVGVYPFGLE